MLYDEIKEFNESGRPWKCNGATHGCARCPLPYCVQEGKSDKIDKATTWNKKWKLIVLGIEEDFDSLDELLDAIKVSKLDYRRYSNIGYLPYGMNNFTLITRGGKTLTACPYEMVYKSRPRLDKHIIKVTQKDGKVMRFKDVTEFAIHYGYKLDSCYNLISLKKFKYGTIEKELI